MGITLDDYLATIDKWKQPVSDRVRRLPASERHKFDRDARAWLESKLGRKLRRTLPSRRERVLQG